MRARPLLHVLLHVLLASFPLLHAAAAEPAPPEAFFDNPPLAAPQLSPSGKYLAVRASKPGSRDALVVFDLAAGTSKMLVGYDTVDVAHFQWVNDERLLYDLTDKSVPPMAADYANGLFAINRDGSGALQLASRTGDTPGGPTTGTRLGGRKLLPWHTYMLNQRGAQDSEYVYVASPDYDARERERHVDLLRLNTLTGQSQKVPAPDAAYQWLLDQHGEPRIALSRHRDTFTMHYLDPSSGHWRSLLSQSLYTEDRDTVSPLAFGPDGTLYVTARAGADTSTLRTFDLATGKVGKDPLVRTAGYDYNGELVTTHEKLLGLHFVTDAESEEWLDPAMKALQQQIDKLLPGTINLLAVPSRGKAPWVLVESYSDTLPPTYLLYDTRSGELKKLGSSHPGIDSRQMGHQQPVRYKARDGLDIPGLLTLPAGPRRGKLPLVVLVHGGPWVGGSSWGWNPQSQFLASRGYAVLEPQFRGSTGLGARHFTAGLKQWGLAMQDDVADGARWAIAQGIADPKRICIAGASYGGYAALMGLVNDPGLYRCAIDWAGVTDINLMYTDTWNSDSDISEENRTYGMPGLIGDPVKDAAQLKATSPLEQAARITQPLLLAYGGRDRRVPIFHGKKFHEAVKAGNKNVEWIEYPDEGHGWAMPATRIDFWTRVEKFLDRHIGEGAAKQ